jgi:hypothetical protein
MAIRFTGSGIVMADGLTLSTWGSRTADYFITPNGTLFNFMIVSPAVNTITTYNFPVAYSTIFTAVVGGITEQSGVDRYCMLVHSYTNTTVSIRNTMGNIYPVNIVAIGKI